MATAPSMAPDGMIQSTQGAPMSRPALFRRPRIRFGGYEKSGFLAGLLFNIPTATLLILVSFPFFIIVPLIILIQDGRPVFYKGERMGRNKKTYMMYKFRTLVKDAEQRLGGKMLSSSDRLELPIGRFLRESRLDELPQLINVVRRDMDLVGPRPERRAVYEAQCRELPGYENRFNVRPGLIGYSQLFTPHNAPKRARVILDNLYVRRKQKWHVDILFFTLAILWLAKRAFLKGVKMAMELGGRLVRQGKTANNRASERIKPPHTEILLNRDGQRVSMGTILDISDEGVVFRTDRDMAGESVALRMRIEAEFAPRPGVKRKSARCQGQVLRSIPLADGGFRTVVLYKPARPLDLLLIHQYFLAKSIV